MSEASLEGDRAPDASGAVEPALVACLITASSKAQALEIARALVGERLAACVNVVEGVTSVYRWEGKVCEDPEVLLVAKTRRAHVPALAARVKALHSYACPETIALPILGGAEAYLRWVEAETA